MRALSPCPRTLLIPPSRRLPELSSSRCTFVGADHRKLYDLSDRGDRVRVYEQVLREGNADDVRRFIDVEELIALWDDLVLPPYVRRAWAAWFRRHGRSDLAC